MIEAAMLGSPATRSKSTPFAWAAIPLALLLMSALAERSEASILQSDSLSSADDVLLALDGGAATGSMAPSENSQSAPPPAPAEELPNAPFALNHGAPTSNGSTSSPSSGVSAGGAMSCVLTAELVVDHDGASTSLAIGQSFSLPTPPGVELLRPPQQG